MKVIIGIFILSTFCALSANGFFGKKTFKDGCDPNPCKNKAPCKLDPRNSTAFTCECTSDYFGKICDQKTGCSKKPCRKGICTNDRLNPANYTCKCNASFVGRNCDTADGCAKKPCKNGQCSLDAKLKPVCACSLGWTSKNCDKKECNITQFKGKQFSKQSAKALVHLSVIPKMEKLDGLAKLCGVKLHIVKSFTPMPDYKKHMNDLKRKIDHHLIGHALEVNTYDLNDKLECNDVCLNKIPCPQPKTKCFLDGINAIGWHRSVMTPTVLTTNEHFYNQNEYMKVFESVQVGCQK